ncbi:hypothetical protein Tco_1065600 [Tanacetum coccineum]
MKEGRLLIGLGRLLVLTEKDSELWGMEIVAERTSDTVVEGLLLEDVLMPCVKMEEGMAVEGWDGQTGIEEEQASWGEGGGGELDNLK